MDKLGDKTYSAMFALKGDIELQKCKDLTDTIIKKIGMSKAHESAVFNYPFDGKGDGYIYIQPIIESFIAWDVWFSLHGAYLTVCSCKAFDVVKVYNILELEGIHIISMNSTTMGIGLPNE